MKAMVFAAGLGTRLRPLTDSRPKALVEVGGKPLLGHLMEKLQSQGFDEVVVNVHSFADMIEDYIRSNGGFGMRVSFSNERDLLRDTGGGLLHARPLLEGSGSFLVHNVDVLTNLDFSILTTEPQTKCGVTDPAAQQKNPEPALATLIVSDRPTSRYLLFNENMRLVGWENLRTGEIRSPYLKKAGITSTSTLGIDAPEVKACPELHNATPFAFSGIQIISDKIFPELEKYASNYGEVFSIIDFYIATCNDLPLRALIPPDFQMLDVGKLDTLSLAESFILDSCVDERSPER